MLTISLILERILQYLGIEQEPKATMDGVPPAYWPASGALRVENLSARYSLVRVIPSLRTRYRTHRELEGWSSRTAWRIFRS